MLNGGKEKGCPDLAMKIEFDKARGLRPDETEDYEAVHSFNGNWTKQKARTTDRKAVSYTQLSLPTNKEVKISLVAVSLKT